MKLFFIIGLEHSGTTLTDHLLSTHPEVLGLGEIASFFSPTHMRQYLKKWGRHPEALTCSCKKSWEECAFWGEIGDLCGLKSDAPMPEKYRKLFLHVARTQGDDAVIVDSSKSLAALNVILDAGSDLGISSKDVFVIFTIKDVRSFVASMIRKQGASRSLISIYRCFNYWLGANKKILSSLRKMNVDIAINLYEELCANPAGFVSQQLNRAGLSEPMLLPDLRQATSHVAMGNKDFILRNSNHVRYDSRWFHDDLVNLVYLLHPSARSFNHHIHASVDSAKRAGTSVTPNGRA